MYIETAEIKIDGKDTYTERIGEFRELVKSVLNKEVKRPPEETIIIDKSGEDRKAILCGGCGADLGMFTGNRFAAGAMRYCPVCGRRIK